MKDFESELNSIENELQAVGNYCDKIGRAKLVVFLSMVLLAAFNIEKKTVVIWFIVAVMLVLFIAMLLIHSRKLEKREYLAAKKHVLKNYQLREKGEWKSFDNTGEEFLTEESYLERDLDILGEKSLYQYLCVANTFHGKKKLADYLTNKCSSIEEIKKRAEAVKELAENKSFRVEFETLSYQSQKNVKDKTDEWFHNFTDITFSTKFELLFDLIGFLPIIALLGLGLAFITDYGWLILAASLSVNIILAYVISLNFMNEINSTENFCRGLDNILKMIEIFNSEKFDAVMLKDMQAGMNEEADLITGIRKLSKINDGFAARRNVYVHVLLQLFLIYDLQYVNKLRRWKKVYGKNFKKIFDILGELEALLSLGVLALNHEVSYPELCESKRPVLLATDLYHPLIDKEQVVSNNIEVTKGINIITGSNMSGKSTFMRTVGVNTVLAFAGAPVCAREMKLSLMNLYTCMRVTDDVFMGRSSFYAEVLRIKTIIDASKQDEPMLVIIDEIFKGTNSIDRVAGAKEIVKQLDKENIMLWVSTHDLEICSLIEDEQVKGNNYHFLEHYEDNRILFDYKIKDGKCMSRNAEYILKMAGLY